jgi:hypothetical protein
VQKSAIEESAGKRLAFEHLFHTVTPKSCWLKVFCFGVLGCWCFATTFYSPPFYN